MHYFAGASASSLHLKHLLVLSVMIGVLALGGAAAQNKPAVPDNDLIEAARKGDVYGILTALDSGININDRGRDRRPALVVAAEWGHLDAIEYLLKRGASIDLRAGDDQTALGAAALWGHHDIAAYLLVSGADPNRAALDNEVPLITAVRLGDFAMAELLVRNGADRGETDRTGRTAMDWAQQSRNRKIGNLLSAQNHAPINPEVSDPITFDPTTSDATIPTP